MKAQKPELPNDAINSFYFVYESYTHTNELQSDFLSTTDPKEALDGEYKYPNSMLR